jgi:hypothetical protein
MQHVRYSAVDTDLCNILTLTISRYVQKAELHTAEEQILRRIPIGGYVPEKAVVEQLSRLGLDSATVRRACVYLVQREVLCYKKERRVLHRTR